MSISHIHVWLCNTFSVLRGISFFRTASNEPSVTTEQVKHWLIAGRNTIPMFFSLYDVFSGKFQSVHFVIFRDVCLRRSYWTVKIYFMKSLGNSVPWYFDSKVSISFFRDNDCCRKSVFFFILFFVVFFTSIHLSSLAVVFLSFPGGFLVSHDPISPNTINKSFRFAHFLWDIRNREFIFIT